ncbi:MAG: glycosyltransferase family 39 protein [Candidatus Nitrotoga sp.]|nr:glycosyltransferase family 39 protein [Candidatus Nitrotoga sp.]MDO9448558.1 glycosyltransferase family 39 protein [Candidatus Nitrotoga sp.]
MFSYPPAQEHPITIAKAWLLALLCAVWLGTGLVGHDPWQSDDAYSFGLVYHILQSGDWLVPTLADEPHMDKPPLFYMTAALFAKLFSPLLELHDGARLASGFYTALTLLFIGLSGRELFGRSRGWPAAIILIGCLGMLVRSHELITDLALLTGCAMMLYGYTLSLRRTLLAGMLIGNGIGIGFMSKGFIAPTLFVLISAALLLFRTWRMRSFLSSLGIALLFALPWLTVWPFLLYQRSPELFMEWFWTLNIGHWFGYIQGGDYAEALYYVKILPWFAWPAMPLAAWAVWEARRRVLHEAEFQLLLVSFFVMLLTLSALPNIKEVFALPILLPLALLANAALPTLRRGAANALDWFGIMTFGFVAILMWWGWAGLLRDNHAKITRWLKDYQPGFEPAFHAPTFWVALTFTVLWVLLVWRVGRSMRRAVLNWASGVTLLWVLAMTLWLPWLDNGKSYRGMVVSLKQAMPQHHGCVASLDVGDTQRAMLQYLGNITTHKQAQRVCDLLLVHGGRATRLAEEERAWVKLWEGNRKGVKSEPFRLYQRIEAATQRPEIPQL